MVNTPRNKAKQNSRALAVLVSVSHRKNVVTVGAYPANITLLIKM